MFRVATTPKMDSESMGLIDPEIRKAFREVDVDDSGFITFEEFKTSKFARNMRGEDLKNIFRQLDTDKMGTVDIFEWNEGVQAGLIMIYPPGDPRNEALIKLRGPPGEGQGEGLENTATALTSTLADRFKMRKGTIVGNAAQASSGYKLIDLGTCVGLKDVAVESGNNATDSLLSLTAIQFQGTPAYSSPENFNDVDKVGFATDVWSLAASMFHLVSGKLPFDARTPLAASVSIAGDMEAKPPDVRDFVPDEQRSGISHGFAEVLKRGLERKLENRYASIDQLAKALHGCLVQRGEEMYSAFISYRVFSEKYHATLLYDALNNSVTPAGHRVIVYLDAKRLVKGEGWEEGFSLGLMNSLVALPLISAGVLKPMTQLTGGDTDKADNVCKELLIMQSLLGKGGKLEAIYPILVGPPLPEGEPNYPGTDDFFARNRALVDALPDRRSPATMDAAHDFLKTRSERAAEAAKDFTVKSTVNKILAIQVPPAVCCYEEGPLFCCWALLPF